MSNIYIYYYSETTKKYYYINQKVRDIRTNIEGKIFKLVINNKNIPNHLVVKFENQKQIYKDNNLKNLETF